MARYGLLRNDCLSCCLCLTLPPSPSVDLKRSTHHRNSPPIIVRAPATIGAVAVIAPPPTRAVALVPPGPMCTVAVPIGVSVSVYVRPVATFCVAKAVRSSIIIVSASALCLCGRQRKQRQTGGDQACNEQFSHHSSFLQIPALPKPFALRSSIVSINGQR